MSPSFAYYLDGTGISTSEGVDRISITNSRGEFLLLSKRPLKAVSLWTEAPGFVTGNLDQAAVAGDPIEIRMIVGATVRGRVMEEGRPRSGVAVGLVQVDRRMDKFVGDYSIGTDENGYFVFSNVAPGFEYYIYGMMDSFRDRNRVIEARKITVGADKSRLDAGELTVSTGCRIRGRVQLSDGAAIPPDTRLLLSREGAWDTQFAALDEQGRFEFAGAPRETVSLVLRIKGYRYSRANPNYDSLRGCLMGTIDGDVDDLVLLMEPGEYRFERDTNHVSPAEKPFRSASQPAAP